MDFITFPWRILHKNNVTKIKTNKQTKKKKTRIQTKMWRFGNKANLQHQIFYSQEFYHSTLSIWLNINGKELIVKNLKGV